MRSLSLLFALFASLLIVTPAHALEDDDFTYTDAWAFPAGGDFDRARGELGYVATEQTAHIRVPDDALAAGRPMGIYVHLNAGDAPHRPGSWGSTLDSMDLAYCSPDNAGGAQNLFRRFFRVVDCVASLAAAYDIDMNRVVLGGYSAGGVSALDIVVAWQELFRGGISHARTVPWEPEPIATRPGQRFAAELDQHDNAMVLSGLRSRGRRFAFISGEEDIIAMSGGDFANYEGILKSLHQYWERDLPTRFFDVPGMQHRPADAESLEDALRYVLDCEDDGSFPPRFDSNHRPPHTPVAAPTVMAPACGGDPPLVDAGPGGLDAGAADAGSATDAGTVDAGGPLSDAAPRLDAGSSDAGVEPDPADGCSCRVGYAASRPWAGFLLGLAAWALRRRRRQREQNSL
ncbi:MAG: prolyl oligopeptidase family serine peptidase [Sandaracinaceae bacterium]